MMLRDNLSDFRYKVVVSINLNTLTGVIVIVNIIIIVSFCLG